MEVTSRKSRFVTNRQTSDDVRINMEKSMGNIALIGTGLDGSRSDSERIKLLANDLYLVKAEVELKSDQAMCRANWYRIINTLSSLVILISSAVIIGLQAASDCVNIPVIVLSSIIFVMEGTHKLFRWGPRGVFYKHLSIQLKRLQRQITNNIYMLHKYTVDQLIILVTQLRSQYDDIDYSMYQTSMPSAAKYNTGFEVEENHNFAPDNIYNSGNITPVLPRGSISAPSTGPPQPRRKDTESHVHIHIAESPSVKGNVLHTPSRKISLANSPGGGVPKIDIENYSTSRHSPISLRPTSLHDDLSGSGSDELFENNSEQNDNNDKQ